MYFKSLASARPALARRSTRLPPPGWKSKLPEGVKEYKSPTAIVWLLGRIYCTGTPEDYAAVHKMQDEISLVPLSPYGKPYTPSPGEVDPSIDMKTAVVTRSMRSPQRSISRCLRN